MRDGSGLAITRRLKKALSDRQLGAWFFASKLGRRVRRRLYQIRGTEVVRVAGALDEAGLRWFLAGGWGVDALLHRRTRPHGDLDVCVEVADDGERKAVDALERLGYWITVHRAPSGHRFPYRSVLRDRAGRTIDLIMVTCRDRSPTEEDVPVLTNDERATGTISVKGRSVTVPCLAADLQVDLHLGYIPKARDRHDVAMLCREFDISVPPVYERQAGPRPLPDRLDDAARDLVGRIRGTSAVVFLVPEADHVRDAVGSQDPGGLGAHLTVAYPFVAPRRLRQSDRDQLAAIAARMEPFNVELGELGHHELVSFLTVTPDQPVREAAVAVFEQFPDYPPYGDAELDVAPHVTVGLGVLPHEIAETVEPLLPIEAELSQLVLMARGLSGRWRPVANFALVAQAVGRRVCD